MSCSIRELLYTKIEAMSKDMRHRLGNNIAYLFTNAEHSIYAATNIPIQKQKKRGMWLYPYRRVWKTANGPTTSITGGTSAPIILKAVFPSLQANNTFMFVNLPPWPPTHESPGTVHTNSPTRINKFSSILNELSAPGWEAEPYHQLYLHAIMFSSDLYVYMNCIFDR